ncbi:MAG TPA: NAD(P)/FAD-dependent oxidoreductase [Bacteroidales bacterium]|nr:NAD(P)/FAD-dependent oxidoreductase [Bacteroidales bacterium]
MLNLKNKFIFAPVKTGYSDDKGVVTKKHLSFYKARSEFIGAVTPEPLFLDKGLRELPTQMGIDSHDKIDGLKKLTDTIHQFDTKVIAHLNHPGRMANPKIPGNYFVSSTNQACENGGASPKQMDANDIKQVVSLFADAAQRAEKAGFDIIELQFGHGYLAAQFISTNVNKRTDQYGGSFENRIRFPLQILDAVKAATHLPIIVRISGDEMVPNGIKVEEMIQFSKILKDRSVEAIHVSAGTVCSTPPWFFQHMFVPKGKTWELANMIKEAVDIPIIYVGQINEFKDVDKVLNEFKADFVAIGRSLLADPDFAGKYLGKIQGNLRPCLACAEGCLGGVKSGLGLQCLVNPKVGKEIDVFGKAEKHKNIAVVGGGLAGMEAALTLNKRGHKVTLFEKEKLGGQFRFAPLTPNKKSMEKLIPFYLKELHDNNITVIYKEATEQDIIYIFDETVIATGSKPAKLIIDGLENFYWAEILLEEKLPKNKNVLIIGGGLIGVDIATALISLNNRVTIVKRTTDFGEDMEMIAKSLSLKMMKEKGTVFSAHTHIKKIDGRTIYAEKEGKEVQFNDIDIIVVSTGMKSYNPLMDELNNKIPIHIIGDAKEVGNAQDAIKDAYETAMKI